jgi:hypothetical protein
MCYLKVVLVNKTLYSWIQEINLTSAKLYFGGQSGGTTSTNVKFCQGAALLNPPPLIASQPKHQERSLPCLRRRILRKETFGTLARFENDLKGRLASVTYLLFCAIKAA